MLLEGMLLFRWRKQYLITTEAQLYLVILLAVGFLGCIPILSHYPCFHLIASARHKNRIILPCIALVGGAHTIQLVVLW